MAAARHAAGLDVVDRRGGSAFGTDGCSGERSRRLQATALAHHQHRQRRRLRRRRRFTPATTQARHDHRRAAPAPTARLRIGLDRRRSPSINVLGERHRWLQFTPTRTATHSSRRGSTRSPSRRARASPPATTIAFRRPACCTAAATATRRPSFGTIRMTSQAAAGVATANAQNNSRSRCRHIDLSTANGANIAIESIDNARKRSTPSRLTSAQRKNRFSHRSPRRKRPRRPTCRPAQSQITDANFARKPRTPEQGACCSKPVSRCWLRRTRCAAGPEAPRLSIADRCNRRAMQCS